MNHVNKRALVVGCDKCDGTGKLIISPLKKMRKDAGLDQSTVAKELNFTRTSISNLENGRQQLSIDKIKPMARLYGVSEIEILEAIAEATPATICGKSIDEVVIILNSLELERIEDMKMTMANLDKWMESVREDHHQAVQKAINKTFATLKENR